MFTGLSAFPLTPLAQGEVVKTSFISLIENLVKAGVDSIGALGSTGSYCYLTRAQRLKVTRLAVKAAAGTPVITSIGHVCAEEVLRLAEDAQNAGVRGVLLVPVSYQKLTPDEVYRLYEKVSATLSVPLCIYDNEATTGFMFTDELLIALSHLSQIGSIKLGTLPTDRNAALQRITRLKASTPKGITLGISGDTQSALGMLVGCDVWYSALGGLLPRYCKRLAHAALTRDENTTQYLTSALESLWPFYRRYGSLRVMATSAEILGLVPSPCFPFPLQTLRDGERVALENVVLRLRCLEEGVLS